MSRRHRKSERRSNHERWLVSYADFITLLFAFFVVLYASAQVDQRKVGRLAAAIQEAFQQLGIFPGSGPPTSVPLSVDAIQAIEMAKRNGGLGIPPNAKRDSALADQQDAGDADLVSLQDELQKTLEREIKSHEVSIRRDHEGLVISLREFGFFDSGSASLKPSAIPVLDRIASLLAIRTCRLRIEGHTDDVPIHNAQVASNWELSTARATEMVRLMIDRYRFPPERLSAAGYAQYHPIAGNDTEAGRALNRRVDLVILK